MANTKKYAIVALNDSTVTSITLDKYLASKMKIIEECDSEHVAEKTAYWDRIYNYTGPDLEEETRRKYHFHNKKRNLHLWSDTDDRKKIKGIRHFKEFELVD